MEGDHGATWRDRTATAPARWTLVALWVLLAGLVWWRFQNVPRQGAVEPRPVTARGDLAADETATISLFREASPSVVFITTLTVRRNALSMDLAETPSGTGSGFLWDRAGHVVTNFHVIQQANAARVTLSDHSTWEAQVVGAAPDKDLAVLRIAAPEERLPAILVGSSHDLEVGQKVFAIGNPFGLDQTLTTGIISGLDREVRAVTGRPIQGVIQTDAAINPGNSGGPLLDSAGRLIGVNSAIVSPSGAYAGIGFAVPVDTVNRVVPQLISHGRVIRPGLGVTIAADAVTRKLQLPGVLVVGVSPDSAAEKAGLRATQFGEQGRLVLGDVIVAIDGEPIRKADDLYRRIDRLEVGATVKLQLLREGQQAVVNAVLEALPQ